MSAALLLVVVIADGLLIGLCESSGAVVNYEVWGRRQENAMPNVSQLSLTGNGRPAAKAEAEEEGPKLSKSQMMRLRKKKREGKI